MVPIVLRKLGFERQPALVKVTRNPSALDAFVWLYRCRFASCLSSFFVSLGNDYCSASIRIRLMGLNDVDNPYSGIEIALYLRKGIYADIEKAYIVMR